MLPTPQGWPAPWLCAPVACSLGSSVSVLQSDPLYTSVAWSPTLPSRCPGHCSSPWTVAGALCDQGYRSSLLTCYREGLCLNQALLGKVGGWYLSLQPVLGPGALSGEDSGHSYSEAAFLAPSSSMALSLLFSLPEMTRECRAGVPSSGMAEPGLSPPGDSVTRPWCLGLGGCSAAQGRTRHMGAADGLGSRG